MNRRTRGSRRVTPYSIPTETLGHIYRHVENPSAFGMVNRTFRSVRADPLFENQRKLQMLEIAIRRNGGSRVFIDNIPALAYDDDKFFYKDHECVSVETGEILVTASINIKRVRYKAIFGITPIMRDAPFKPVGRFSIQDTPSDREIEGASYYSNMPTESNQFHTPHEYLEIGCNDRVDENIPELRSDLLRAIRSDLQNSCTPRNIGALSKKYFNYKNILHSYLGYLRIAEDEQYSVRQIVNLFFQPILITEDSPEIIKENVQIVGDTLEITLPVKLSYHILQHALIG